MQTHSDATMGPVELCVRVGSLGSASPAQFVNAGHRSRVLDACWYPASSGADPFAWTAASIEEGGEFMLWQIVRHL